MTTLIILVVLLIIGIMLCYSWNYEVLGIILTVLTAVLLFFHIIEISFRSYDFNVFNAKRNAFELTLTNARTINNQYEIAAITKDIAEWNECLAEYQYKNKTFFFDPYIDDRIDQLKPIR